MHNYYTLHAPIIPESKYQSQVRTNVSYNTLFSELDFWGGESPEILKQENPGIFLDMDFWTPLFKKQQNSKWLDIKNFAFEFHLDSVVRIVWLRTQPNIVAHAT